MAKILLIISALVTAATAYFGFATKQKVESLQGNLKDTSNRLTSTTADLTKAKKERDTEKEQRIAAEATLSERDTLIAKQKGDLDRANSELEKAKADVEARVAEIAKIKTELESGGVPGVNPAEMAAKVKELQEAKTKLEQDLAEARQVQETLNAKVEEASRQLAGSERQVQEYKQQFVRTGLSGTILAYNPNWNFVVLSIGDRQGLKPNAQMVVSRDGQMVGKVRVTSVEPSSAIADIVPGSVPKGMAVQQGDSVVFQGRTN